MQTLALAALIAAAGAAGLGPEDPQCHVVHYAADGTRTESAPSRPYSRPAGAAASARSTGGSASSVSASSSSSSDGPTVVRTQAGGRTITKTYENTGCTIVIDERPPEGAR